jgi:hypothetical protein
VDKDQDDIHATPIHFVTLASPNGWAFGLEIISLKEAICRMLDAGIATKRDLEDHFNVRQIRTLFEIRRESKAEIRARENSPKSKAAFIDALLE